MFSSEEESYLTIPDIEPVKTFLANALNMRISGEKTQYDLIVNQLRVRDDPDTLWKVLVALCHFTYQLTKQPEDYRGLLNCVFGYDWKCDIKVTVAVINLINHLVSTNSTFLGRAFQLYVKSLLPSMTTSTSSESSEESGSEHRQLIHRALRGILIQVPTGRSVLYPILCDYFPHKRFSRNVQTEYTAQLLQICTYEPMLQAKILELIIMKCMEMDVEIVIEDSGDVRIDQQALDDGDLDFEDAFEDSNFMRNQSHSRGHSRTNSQNNFGGNKRKQLTDANPTRIPAEVSEMADKLDSILLLVVEFCERQICGAPTGSISTTQIAHHNASPTHPPPSPGARERILQQLLAIFESNIMTIHKSKFVQFVIFFAAQKHIPFAQAVAEKLITIALDERAPGTQRQSAVMYLSSYLSRATFLSTEFISTILCRLLSWAAAYSTRTGGIAISPATSSLGLANLPSVVSSSALSTASGSGKGDLKRSFSSGDQLHCSAGHESGGPGTGWALGDSLTSGESVEFDEFGRAFVREVTASRHELFYSVVQAVCYTLCFYGVNMAAKQRDDPTVRRCWETVVTCRFDPLRYTLRSVRVEFIRLAAAVELFSAACWDSIPADLLYAEILQQQQNRLAQDCGAGRASRVSDSATLTTFTTQEATSHGSVYASARVAVQSHGVVVTSGGHREVQSSNTLDSFFPFDPCLLCKLHQTIQNSYRVWDGVPGLDDVDEDYDLSDDDDDDDEEDEEENASGIAGGIQRSIKRAIPSARKSGKRSDPQNAAGSQMSESMVDAFTTSSLSSVVSSIACTDMAMSVASSIQYTSHSPFVGSYLSAAHAQMRSGGGDFGSEVNKSSRKDDDNEDSDEEDSGMHDAHMAVPTGGISIGNSAEKHDGNYRRPRFYSIGSTGSW